MNNSKKAFSLVELSIVILVIGILVAAITKGKEILISSKQSSAEYLTKGSQVAFMKDLEVWFETTSNDSFDELEAVDGELVSTWYNINPNSFKKVNFESSGDDRPKYVKNGINNLPSLKADGTDVMLINSLTDSFEDTGFTWIGVLEWIKPQVGPKGYFGLKSTTGAGGNQGVTLFFDDSNAAQNKIRVISRNDGSLNSVQILHTTNQYNPHIVSIIRSKTSLKAYDNGSLMKDVKDSTTNGIFKTSTPWSAFKYTNDNTLYFNGLAGEYIIFSRPISDSERNRIEEYLSSKWSIKLN